VGKGWSTWGRGGGVRKRKQMSKKFKPDFIRMGNSKKQENWRREFFDLQRDQPEGAHQVELPEVNRFGWKFGQSEGGELFMAASINKLKKSLHKGVRWRLTTVEEGEVRI